MEKISDLFEIEISFRKFSPDGNQVVVEWVCVCVFYHVFIIQVHHGKLSIDQLFSIGFLFIFFHDPRYGSPNELLELGKVSPGTYCTRQYDECYRKRCRLQSPNYPGMYPRNVTCYWTIRQRVVPTCKHAMVAISQENEHKALVKRWVVNDVTVQTGRECKIEKERYYFSLSVKF